MKKKNFTLGEMIIVVVIIGILATIAVPMYNNLLDDARAKACEVNLKAILAAVEAQTLEQDAFPADLSSISDQNLNRAWAKVLKEEGAWKVKLAYFLVDLDNHGLAYAQWVGRFISANSGTLRCPADTDGGVSYGINGAARDAVNGAVQGRRYAAYQLLTDNVVIVGDSNGRVFNAGGLEDRHKRGSTKYALGVNRFKRKLKLGRAGNILEGGDDNSGGETTPTTTGNNPD